MGKSLDPKKENSQGGRSDSSIPILLCSAGCIYLALRGSSDRQSGNNGANDPDDQAGENHPDVESDAKANALLDKYYRGTLTEEETIEFYRLIKEGLVYGFSDSVLDLLSSPSSIDQSEFDKLYSQADGISTIEGSYIQRVFQSSIDNDIERLSLQLNKECSPIGKLFVTSLKGGLVSGQMAQLIPSYRLFNDSNKKMVARTKYYIPMAPLGNVQFICSGQVSISLVGTTSDGSRSIISKPVVSMATKTSFLRYSFPRYKIKAPVLSDYIIDGEDGKKGCGCGKGTSASPSIRGFSSSVIDLITTGLIITPLGNDIKIGVIHDEL